MWQAVAADETLRRSFSDPDLDDRQFVPMAVPHHWRSHPAFADSDGPLLYRRRFETPATPETPEGGPPGVPFRTWLQFDGLFYQGDVWLDGSYLGDTEGYFFPHVFEVTEALAQRREHLLALELTCDRPPDKAAKRNLTGVFQDWDCIDGEWNPGGIWRPVRLLRTGPVRIAKLRVLCIEANAERATAELRATLDAQQAAQVTVTTVLRGPSGRVVERTAEHSLAAGANQVSWKVPVEHPELWWPHALGGQPLYDVTVTVNESVDGPASDQRSLRTGLRQVRMRNFVATVNGERLFLKGANQGPTRRELGEATREQLEGDVVLAREAGLDLLRVHGHISRPELYDAADRHGVLLWQDLPLQWGYAGVRRQAMIQAVEAVNLLGHHPALAVWCGHNDPVAVEHPASTGKLLARQFRPSWNMSVLDRSIQRALEKADGSRPVVAHSGVLPHPAWGTDSHLYYGWYGGSERDFPAVLARFPVLARFVSEFGAQAVPDGAPWCHPPDGPSEPPEGHPRWPDLDWAHLARAYGLQKAQFDRYVPPASYPTLAAWREATQAYQAQVIRFHVETLRRLKYRPTGGFCQFMLGDAQPAVSWSVLDDQRRPKAAWATLAAACAPVIVVADRPEESYRPGDHLELAVHVVSDLRVAITEGRVVATLSWGSPGSRGDRSWHFAGEVAADSCVRVGVVHLTAPDDIGPLILDVDLSWPGGKAHNRYVSEILH
jgi:beta-mannosidase